MLGRWRVKLGRSNTQIETPSRFTNMGQPPILGSIKSRANLVCCSQCGPYATPRLRRRVATIQSPIQHGGRMVSRRVAERHSPYNLLPTAAGIYPAQITRSCLSNRKVRTMSTSTILVATDFSDGSKHALEYATASAKMTGATLLIVHVHVIPSMADGEGMLYGGLEFEDDAALMRTLKAVKPEIDGIAYEHRLLKGDPAKEILHLANEENASLIVMGTHGRTGLMRLLMGSVAEEVVRKANCPVLTIKIPSEAS